MNFWDDKGKVLAEMEWNDHGIKSEVDVSGWAYHRNAIKSRSLEFRNTPTFRPKLMLPRPKRVRKPYSPSINTPQPMAKSISPSGEKIESLILKLLEKGQKKAKDVKFNNTYRIGNRIVTRIPFLNYKLNLPRSLNMLKAPKQVKGLSRANKRPLASSFAYKLTGTSLLSSKFTY
ncbi:hypothetical protein SteCoe_8221 [Stentor coeruleus]|uniref:Uncharacterized protein n=1 Tax=Stentor coeruleus TaxID=5963 RepID=A0A1R2CKV1_9CILI|nr:hypothetical protein SteCoe_8221 [Stentor coeruleus]